MHPPSLSQTIRSRSFRAGNGELGLLPEDVPSFLDACQTDSLTVLGWEIWLADHEWDNTRAAPAHAIGLWCGLIPMQGKKTPSIISGSGDLTATRNQLASLELTKLIDPKWSNYVRVNVAIA